VAVALPRAIADNRTEVERAAEAAGTPSLCAARRILAVRVAVAVGMVPTVDASRIDESKEEATLARLFE
jgi:hypothetical protein